MSIPFSKINSRPRRASEQDRDHAALALVGYIAGILRFAPEAVAEDFREGLIARIGKVRQTQGLEQWIFVNETTARIRAGAEQ
jgi:hypothetical protein